MRPIAVACLMTLAAPTAGLAGDSLPPQIVHEPCDEYKKGEGFELWARFYDESQIFEPKVIYRSGDARWKNAPFKKEPGKYDFRAFIRAKDLRGSLEYFIEAFDENGNGPARFGSLEAPVKVAPSPNPAPCHQIGEPDHAVSTSGSNQRDEHEPDKQDKPPNKPPIELPPPPPPTPTCEREDRPLYCSPVLWIVAGTVVLAGTGAGVYWALRTHQPEHAQIVISAPDPTQALGWRGPR